MSKFCFTDVFISISKKQKTKTNKQKTELGDTFAGSHLGSEYEAAV